MTELRGQIEWSPAPDVRRPLLGTGQGRRCLRLQGKPLPSDGSVSAGFTTPGKFFPVWVCRRTRFESHSSMFPPPAHVGALNSNRVRSHARHWTGKWGHRWDLRPALLDTNETPRYLGFGGMVQAEGIAVSARPRARSRGTSVVQSRTAFIVRRDCCCSPRRPRCGHPHDSPLASSGLRHLRAVALRPPRLDGKWGHGPDLRRRSSPYEGDVLHAELPCHGGPPR